MSTGVSWDALRVFIAVARAGSFSAAATELRLAQSSVSEQVARLETSLGYRLLDRSPTGVRPTDRGRDLIARIGDAVDTLAAVTDVTAAGGEAPERTIFVAGPAEFLSEIVLPRLHSQLPPGVRIAVRFGLADELIDALRSGAVDVLISTLPVRGPDVSSEPIYDEEFALVASPRWEKLAASSLEAVPVLAYGHELPIIRRYWRSVFERRPSELSTTMVVPDLRTLLRLVVDGAGMSVLPTYLVREHLESGALALLHTPEVAPLNTLVVATRTTPRQRDDAVHAIREAIATIARRAAP